MEALDLVVSEYELLVSMPLNPRPLGIVSASSLIDLRGIAEQFTLDRQVHNLGHDQLSNKLYVSPTWGHSSSGGIYASDKPILQKGTCLL